MKISEAIAALQSIQASYGDLDLVSGIDRSGYGEPVEDIEVLTAYTAGGTGFGEPQVKVVDLILSDNSTHSDTAS